MSAADTTPNPRPAVLARTAPFLRRVRIRNYKSIRFCDVALEPLTVFVGRNGSGKSNFFDALAFLRDLMNGPVSAAVDSRGGWKRVLRRQASQPEIEIGFDAAFDAPDGPCEASYTLKLEADAAGQVVIVYERLVIPETSQQVVDGLTEWSSGRTTGQSGGRATLLARFGAPRLGLADGSIHRLLVDLLRTSGVFAFEPSAMRPPQPQRSAALARDGHNLAAALRQLTDLCPDFAERAKQFLSSAVPQVVSCEPLAIGDYETVRFEVLSGSGGAGKFDAASVSDGTLRALAALVAAYQVLPSGRPGFVAIEEPESGLHPVAARALIAAFDEAALTTQVLVSTHSPDLLDAEEVTPERVRVVQFTDGETEIGPVGKAGVSIVRDHLNTLGGLEQDDRLTIDRGDLARQRAAANGAAG